MAIPFGSAKGWTRAATFTASPKRSLFSNTTSPRCSPIRTMNCSRGGKRWLRSWIRPNIFTAQLTARPAVEKQDMEPSPMNFTSRPPKAGISSRKMASRSATQAKAFFSSSAIRAL